MLLATSISSNTFAIEKELSEKASVLRGRVMDNEQQVLPGASIMVESLKKGIISDIDGNYTLTGLKPGTYTVKVSYVGYNPIELKITVPKGKTLEKDIVMNEGVELQEVKVNGVFTGQRKALSVQKNAMGVKNVVSADQVGKFPDSNIGDALKRISGINVQYDQGEARFGQVRGTSADLTSVTVNGNRLPSAEGDTRNVQLDLIPADMVQTIEVSKVVTSDMDGDAIGGAINLVTKNTPYNRVFNVTAGTGYNWISEKAQLNLGATWGERLFNDKLGIMLAASYQYAPGGSDNVEFEYETNDDGEVELKEAQARQYYVTRERQSYSAALDYKFNENHKISFKGIYNRRNDWENRYRVSYKKLNSKASKQSVVLQTKAGSSDNRNARLERQQTMDFTLDGEHMLGNLMMDWAGSYSRATEDRPNERYAAISYKGEDYGSSFADVFDEFPYSTKSLPNIKDAGWKIDELTNSNQSIVENEYKFRMNFELPLSQGEFGNSLKFGGKFVSKDKERETNFFEYDGDIIADWNNNLTSQIRSGFMPGKQYPTGTSFIDKGYLGKIDFSKYEGKEVLEEEAGNYKAKENILAGYLRFDQKLGDKFDLTLGLRIEDTHLKTSGSIYQMDENEEESLTPTGDHKNSYTDLLPSILLKYKLNDNGNIRASYTKTLSRPKYSALIANKSFNLADEEATIGDPNTKPTTSNNFDLSIDYYFKSVGLVSAGVFYKDVKSVNVEALGYMTGSQLGLGNYADTKFQVTQNMNAYDARIFGAEFAYQRDFGFIAPALKCVGFYGNYTYTHSSTNNYNPILGIADGDDVKMAGSPEHTANASLFYEKSGLNVRLSYNTASAFIDQMNTGSRELDRYYDSVNYLDLNASYTWGSKYKTTIYAEAGNLLNQPLRYYQGHKDRTMQAEYYGVRVNAGVKINF